MEHKPFADIRRVADVHSLSPEPPLSINERLARWAEALEREPTRELKSLEEIEGKPKAERRDIRADGSALTVAFEDPVLRGAGLASDRLGDASDFFGLSMASAHYVLCSCVHGQTVQARDVAPRVRQLVASETAGTRGLLLVVVGMVALLALSGLSSFIN